MVGQIVPIVQELGRYKSPLAAPTYISSGVASDLVICPTGLQMIALSAECQQEFVPRGCGFCDPYHGIEAPPILGSIVAQVFKEHVREFRGVGDARRDSVEFPEKIFTRRRKADVWLAFSELYGTSAPEKQRAAATWPTLRNRTRADGEGSKRILRRFGFGAVRREQSIEFGAL